MIMATKPQAPAFVPEGTEGISITVDGTTATITVDLAANFGNTSTGKAIKVANSKGWCDLGEGTGVRMNLLATRKPAAVAAVPAAA
jgi:hypothetical protein